MHVRAWSVSRVILTVDANTAVTSNSTVLSADPPSVVGLTPSLSLSLSLSSCQWVSLAPSAADS